MSEEGPIRTCVGCGRRAPKKALMRLVIHRLDSEIELDLPARRGGRGAYLHREAGCIERGLEPRRLAKAFRGRVKVPKALADEVLKATESVAM